MIHFYAEDIEKFHMLPSSSPVVLFCITPGDYGLACVRDYTYLMCRCYIIDVVNSN